MDKVRGEDSDVFVKSSCRSAKDTTLYDKRFKAKYSEFLNKKTEKNLNDKIICLLEAAMEVLKVN